MTPSIELKFNHYYSQHCKHLALQKTSTENQGQVPNCELMYFLKQHVFMYSRFYIIFDNL